MWYFELMQCKHEG